ncbi:TetR/AcrR family transcriptional regulator [Chloroflexota bacterium]
MSGLRERKKKRTKRDIRDAALELFTTKGYNMTSVEAIAEKAEVAVGTVYNYFKCKCDLLLTRLAQDIRELISEGQAVIQNPPVNPVEAVSLLIHIYFRELLNRQDKRLVGEVIAARYSEQPSNKKDLLKLDFMLINQVTELLEYFQQQDKLAKDIKPIEAAGLIYATFISAITLYLYTDTSLETIDNYMERHVRLIFKGLEPH